MRIRSSTPSSRRRCGRTDGEAGWFSTDRRVPHRLLDQVAGECAERARAAGRRGGIRNLLELPAVQELIRVPALRGMAAACVGDDAFVVRGILFDKNPTANWKVAWHQDLTVAVRAWRQAADFVAWSKKEGVLHVQAPARILQRMVAIRVHLDDCGLDNGPVRVLPGSHRHGRLSADQIEAWIESTEPVTCPVERGGILAFRPLLLHASSAATSPGRRRVVHLEFASGSLPHGLEWHMRM